MKTEIKAKIQKINQIRSEIQQVIVGQTEVIDQLLICLLAGGHGLIEGVPGLAKTLMIRTLADALQLKFNRIQFTPDLMPSDIIGTEILGENKAGQKDFRFVEGPIFSNIILADEINRTPPKTQAALLEAMQEFSVTYAGKKHELERPFFILATQNPIEQAGTYPLPEAQLDRFLLYIKIGYPTEEEEFQILSQTTGTQNPQAKAIINGADILELQDLVKQVSINDAQIHRVNKLVRASRPTTTHLPKIKEHLSWGAGPRAGQSLIKCAKARALMLGRFAVIPEDIEAMVYPVMRHRIVVNFKAEAAGLGAEDVIDLLIKNL